MENAILTRLVEITAYSAVLFLTVWLFRTAFRRWLSPFLRYGLWFLVVLRLILPVSLESGFHLFTLPAEQGTNPATSAVEWLVPDGGAAPVTAGPQAEHAPAAQTATAAPVAPPGRFPAKPTWQQWALILWGAGFLTVLGFAVLLSVRLRLRVRRLSAHPGREAQRVFEQIKRDLGVAGRLPMRLMPDITSPALTAQVCPVLLMPDSIADDPPGEALAFSIVHELTHYKRCDHLVCLLLTLLRAVWWFNPVVWLLPRPMRMDMESACDAQVVRHMDREQKLRYANLLLELGQEESE